MAADNEMKEKGKNRDRTPAPKASRAGRPPLREEIAGIDTEILRLLIKRHNLLAKIRHNGKVDASDEKFLRESWQRQVARVSKDADLSGRFFSMLQEMEFLPKPVSHAEEETTPASSRREAFNLAPSRQAVNFYLQAPLSGNATRAWLYVAAAAGKPIRLAPCLQNDPLVDCIKALDQAGAAITREEDAVIVREFAPLERPDKVIHVGDSKYNLFLLIAHYIGAPSRVKFTGETSLKLADFTALGRMLPMLGARLVHIVPKSEGLPARLESSGLLPPQLSITPDLPAQFGEALLLAAPFYEAPFAVDISTHPDKDSILAHVLPVLQACGATFVLDGYVMNMAPCSPAIPKTPTLPMDPELAAYLLAFAELLGGCAALEGQWPDWPETRILLPVLNTAGVEWIHAATSLKAAPSHPLRTFSLEKVPEKLLLEAADWQPLLLSLCAAGALRGSDTFLPECMRQTPESMDFLHACGLEAGADGILEKIAGSVNPESSPIWNAPSPQWAMALALAACARADRQTFRLGNPGIMMQLWPSFWTFYNSLPTPRTKKIPEPAPVKTKERRRIITDVIAQIPELRDEDI